jgi:SYP6 family syntaxin
MQVDELEKAINVAERDPARFNVSGSEIESRRQWTSQTRKEVGSNFSSSESGRKWGSVSRGVSSVGL